MNNQRNDEHFQHIQFTLALAKEVGAAALKVTPQYDALAAAHRREDEALKKITKSARTAKISESDRERDIVYRGTVNAVLSARAHFDPKVSEAAERLLIVLETYGNLAQKSHIEETSALYNLLRELTTNYTADIVALGLGGWMSKLDELNRAVEALLSDRADEDASRTSLVLKEVREEVDAAYLALTAMVDAQALVATLGSDAAAVAMYEGFIRRLNERIDLVNQALAVRKGRAAAKKEEEEAAKKAAEAKAEAAKAAE